MRRTGMKVFVPKRERERERKRENKNEKLREASEESEEGEEEYPGNPKPLPAHFFPHFYLPRAGFLLSSLPAFYFYFS